MQFEFIEATTVTDLGVPWIRVMTSPRDGRLGGRAGCDSGRHASHLGVRLCRLRLGR
ncbi:hypothetical protein D3C71_2207360 [compost metagenome]